MKMKEGVGRIGWVFDDVVANHAQTTHLRNVNEKA